MLSLMRKKAGSWIIKFILGAVILAFIPFGYGIYQDRRDVKIATVNGDPVRFEEFNRQYNNLVEQVRRNFGGSLNEETIKGLRLKEQALNQLIDQKLMLAEAANLGISVSDQELAESIANIEAFQTAGVFDPKRYEYVLSRLRLTQDAFEADSAAGETIVLGISSFARYDALVAQIYYADIDAVYDTYERFYPLFQKAYERLGYPDAYFNDRLIEVIDHLLATPEPEGPIVLARPNVLYEFADPDLEALSSGQKLMLRMGPNNAATLKRLLEKFRSRLTGDRPS